MAATPYTPYELILFNSGNPVNPDSDNQQAKIRTYFALPKIFVERKLHKA
jgi:hypothetical protein